MISSISIDKVAFYLSFTFICILNLMYFYSGVHQLHYGITAS